MRARLLIAALALWIAAGSLCAAPKRVACIGNSITYGYGLEHRDSLSYPAVLQRMLGDDYEVGNFGLSGATLLRHGHRPYTATAQWRDALDFNADIALIHLGINDTDPRDWPLYADEFVADYVALIDTLRSRNPLMRIIISRLSPLRSTHYRWRSGTHRWRLDIQEAIGRIAAATGVELIDFDATLRDHQYLITDGIHPNARGAAMMARTAWSGITGRYGGLRLPEVWQSGMVVQRDRPLRICGTADALSKVKVTVNDGHSTTALTDNRGQWSALLPPFAVGDPYTLTVTDGCDTIRLADILAGDVWIASGQSNMAFPLNASIGSAQTIARSADPMLRLYSQRPRVYTDAIRWSDEDIAAIDTLNYYLPAVWQPATPESTPTASAIAYYFGKELRERTGVPVGIIENAVGGSTLESWIDIATLEAGMPEILVNWRSNDYLQPWAQQRANENTPAEGNHRHPYEPTYLYSAGIRPLEGFDVSGVIWYQGESNAHNTMIFERLFPLFVSSWREALGNPAMPIHTVQLSSIDRPSWPMFRDAQRRLADEIAGVTLTVSSDLGDSLDVHPRDKRPIGRRLALQALHTAADGPLFGGAPTARVEGDAIVLTFPDGVSLATADGLASRTFEIAAIDGLYAPATATITDNTILLMNPDIKHPQFVRYGWQPYTRANVINTPDSLPLSTFKLRADGLPEVEAGMEYGVSAPFATCVDGNLIMAGGCNFPTDSPLAPDAIKKFYQGIYAADTSSFTWHRIGSLPRAMAYGSTIAMPDGMILIGGMGEDGSTADVYRLRGSEMESLPALPVTFDNGAAAAIGSILYVAGGNQDGIPSRDLWALDLSQPGKGWKKQAKMPGNPRTQPVMAASGGRLYLWGGFAGKHKGHDATLECNGLCYDPATGKWSALPAPVADGVEVSLGGGVAATLPDGRIAATGGVNKDVFLSALRNQQPNYLLHPIEWYRFNSRIFVYDPVAGEWQLIADLPDAARAGAAIASDSDGTLYLMGGEVKPRIRTAETLLIEL